MNLITFKIRSAEGFYIIGYHIQHQYGTSNKNIKYDGQ